jgi:hypothetical protein
MSNQRAKGDHFMFKKRSATICIMLLLVLTGCQKLSDRDSQSTSSSASSPMSKQSSTSSSHSSGSSSANSLSAKPAPTSRISQLNKQLTGALGALVLPRNDGLTTGSSHLNIRYTQAANSKTIYYSVGSVAETFNANALQNEYPYAALTLTSYTSANEAAKQVDFQQNAANLPTTDLGKGITGTIDAGAGQRYLHWIQAQWSFLVHAAAVNGEDPVPTGRQVVAWANQYPLPANRGAAQLQVGTSYAALNQQFTWQAGTTVYRLKAHSIETAMKMIASMK